MMDSTVRKEQSLQRRKMRRREELQKIFQSRTTLGNFFDAYLQNEPADDTPKREIAEHYITHWNEMARSGQGLLYYGPMGTGKTQQVCWIAAKLKRQGVSVLAANVSELAQQLATNNGRSEKELLEQICGCDLLVLDDLGTEYGAYLQSKVYVMVDSRYRSRKPMLVTTNLAPTELAGDKSSIQGRICSRILERCVPVELSEINYRERNRLQRMADFKKQLNK